MSVTYRNRPRRDFTILRNTMLRDPRLSLKSKGLLALMLSFPDDWAYHVTHLESLSTDGRDATRAAVRELEAAGYLLRERRRDEAGKIEGLTYVVSDDLLGDETTDGKPGGGDPGDGEPDTTKTEGTKTESPTNEDQKTSSAEPTAPPKRDIEELVALWNEHCGELAKTRVVSREVETKLRALRKRHGEKLDGLFLDGIAAVTHDPFWLGKKSPERDRRNRREGPPYGLVNYLRHMEDKANLVAEERAEEGDAVFPRDFAVGQSWWTREQGAVVVVGVASDRKQAKVRIVRAKDGGPEVGATALIAPADLKTQRHVDVTV